MEQKNTTKDHYKNDDIEKRKNNFTELFIQYINMMESKKHN